MSMDTIFFNDKKYPIREINHPQFGEVTISTNFLNELLFKEDGSYFSEEAISVDERIFYFVANNQFKLPENDLINLLLLEVL